MWHIKNNRSYILIIPDKVTNRTKFIFYIQESIVTIEQIIFEPFSFTKIVRQIKVFDSFKQYYTFVPVNADSREQTLRNI